MLAPASYTAPQQVQTTLLGVSSALDLALASPFAWIAQGATVDVVLTVRVLSNGIPLAGRTANVIFDSVLTRPIHNAPILTTGEAIITRNSVPIILSSSQTSVPSDTLGLSRIQPATGGLLGSTLILGTSKAGTSTLQFALQSLAPVNLAIGSARLGDGLRKSRFRSARQPKLGTLVR